MSEERAESRSVLRRALQHAVFGSDSVAFQTYAVVGTLVATFVSLLFLFAFPEWVLLTDAGPLERVGRAFLGLLGLVLVASILAPVLFVDRRRSDGRPQRQRLFGIAGYAYLASLYLALLASAPADARSEPTGSLAPLVEVFYALPSLAGVLIAIAGLSLPLLVEFGIGSAD